MTKKPTKPAAAAPAAAPAEPAAAPAAAEQTAAPAEGAGETQAAEAPAADQAEQAAEQAPAETPAEQPVAEPAAAAPAAAPAEPAAEEHDEPATHALMTHPDHGTTDAFPVDPTTGAFLVPFDQVETLVPHGFEVVGEAWPQIWSAPEHTASVTLSIGTLAVIGGVIAVPAGLSDTDRAGLVANGFQPPEA